MSEQSSSPDLRFLATTDYFFLFTTDYTDYTDYISNFFFLSDLATTDDTDKTDVTDDSPNAPQGQHLIAQGSTLGDMSQDKSAP